MSQSYLQLEEISENMNERTTEKCNFFQPVGLAAYADQKIRVWLLLLASFLLICRQVRVPFNTRAATLRLILTPELPVEEGYHKTLFLWEKCVAFGLLQKQDVIILKRCKSQGRKWDVYVTFSSDMRQLDQTSYLALVMWEYNRLSRENKDLQCRGDENITGCNNMH